MGAPCAELPPFASLLLAILIAFLSGMGYVYILEVIVLDPR